MYLWGGLITSQQLDELFSQINLVLGKSSTHEVNLFLSQLLGYEERIMLAKRLACIILLIEGISSHRASIILKISPSTADKIKNNIEKNNYSELVKLLGKNNKQYRSLLDTIDSILHLGGILPHYNGLDRYKHLK